MVDNSSITLNRYDDGEWEQLPVTVLKEDNEFTYFTAETAGFSFFAITGKESGFSENVTESGSGPETRSVDMKDKESTGFTAEMSKQRKSTYIHGSEVISEIAALFSEWIEYIRDWAKV